MPCSYKLVNDCSSRQLGISLTVIEPVPKLVEAVRYEVLGCSEVEPRIDCIDKLVFVSYNLYKHDDR